MNQKDYGINDGTLEGSDEYYELRLRSGELE